MLSAYEIIVFFMVIDTFFYKNCYSHTVFIIHDVSLLIYHIVFPAMCRGTVLQQKVDIIIKNLWLAIEKHDEIKFLEIVIVTDHAYKSLADIYC